MVPQSGRRPIRKTTDAPERVTAGVKLDHMDRRPVDEAKAGLARARAEIAALAAR